MKYFISLAILLLGFVSTNIQAANYCSPKMGIFVNTLQLDGNINCTSNCNITFLQANGTATCGAATSSTGTGIYSLSGTNTIRVCIPSQGGCLDGTYTVKDNYIYEIILGQQFTGKYTRN